MKMHTSRWHRFFWNRVMGIAMIIDGICLVIFGRSKGLDLKLAIWETTRSIQEIKYEYKDPSKILRESLDKTDSL